MCMCVYVCVLFSVFCCRDVSRVVMFETSLMFVRTGRGMITFSPGKLDMAKAPPAAYHKMLCYVLQEVRQD